jgi:hypothetical protein
MKKQLFISYCSIFLLLCACKETRSNVETSNETPAIFPDYIGVTIPANIAPLNFTVTGEHKKLHLIIEGSKAGSLELQASDFFSIPEKKWKKLLDENTRGEIHLTVSVESAGKWKQFKPFAIYISPYPIDYGLAYRLIAPGYEVYSKMGIYQRNLSNFKQKAILENTVVSGSCVNCHSFNQTNPDKMSLHIRGANGGTLIKDHNNLKIVNTKTDQTLSACVYPYWHPSEKFIAYSVNKTKQAFHSAKDERIEVLDLASDIVVYDLETHELFSSNLLTTLNLETFPVFSPDGKTLYFCCAREQTLPESYQKIRYNLCSIAFNPDSKTFGSKIDTLIQADIQGKSVSFPKPSFDGKYLLYTLLDYGNFGIWHQEADLYLLDLTSGTSRELIEANSPYSESYHNWSSNSRWFVFESRRLDGLYTRLYIAAIDENGKVGKPFLLPQKNPNDNRELLFSYNVPEFINAPVRLNVNQTEKLILAPEREKVSFKK